MFRAKLEFVMHWQTASDSARKTPHSFLVMPDFSRRSNEDEIMDDLSRPEAEFAGAYRELEIINRWLGGVRAINRFLPGDRQPLILDVAAGACDVAESLAAR